MTYRVSTKPDGSPRWWMDVETIPSDHTGVRDATAEEAALMDEIVRQDAAGRMPPAELGLQLLRLMERENRAAAARLRGAAATDGRLLDAAVAAERVRAAAPDLLAALRAAEILQTYGYTREAAIKLGDEAAAEYAAFGVPGLQEWSKRRRRAAIAKAEGGAS